MIQARRSRSQAEIPPPPPVFAELKCQGKAEGGIQSVHIGYMEQEEEYTARKWCAAVSQLEAIQPSSGFLKRLGYGPRRARSTPAVRASDLRGKLAAPLSPKC